MPRALLPLLLPFFWACNNRAGDAGKDPSFIEGEDSGGADGGGGVDTDSGGGSVDTQETGEPEDTGPEPWEIDDDGDGYSEDEGDCEDSLPDIHPGAEELCDDVDNDCDGLSDADEDYDGDGQKDCSDFCPIIVQAGVPDGGDGTTWHPLDLIQDGIALAESSGCLEVDVFQGTYYENVDFVGVPVDVEGVLGPEATIIDGGGAAPVVSFQTSEGEESRLHGFTITHGGGDAGAGIFINSASPTIEDNLITGNATTGGTHLGGGIRINNGSPVILNNEITYNDAGFGGPENGSDGGGINARAGSPWIEGNLIGWNTAGDGGGLWLAYSDATVMHNTIIGNEAHDTDLEDAGQGGGVNIQIGADGCMVTNNLILSNTASTHGGGVAVFEYHASYGEATVANNVIAWNTVTDTDQGAGIVAWQYTLPDIYNNIVYANSGVGAWLNDTADFRYNNVYGNTVDYDGEVGSLTGSDGNLSVDPRFKGVSDDGNPDNDDWTFAAGSPMIDAGDSAVSDGGGGRSDMGAYGGPEGSW